MKTLGIYVLMVGLLPVLAHQKQVLKGYNDMLVEEQKRANATSAARAPQSTSLSSQQKCA